MTRTFTLLFSVLGFHPEVHFIVQYSYEDLVIVPVDEATEKGNDKRENRCLS